MSPGKTGTGDRRARVSTVAPLVGAKRYDRWSFTGEAVSGSCVQIGHTGVPNAPWISGMGERRKMDSALNPADPGPYYLQLAKHIRADILFSSSYRPGDRLPQAKEIARRFGINSNTVLRALRLLRDEGLIEFRRGCAITVIWQGSRVDPELELLIRQHLTEALQCGVTRDHLIHLLDEVVTSVKQFSSNA